MAERTQRGDSVAGAAGGRTTGQADSGESPEDSSAGPPGGEVRGPQDESHHPLASVSPLDGRYRGRLERLAPIVSEFGLMRYRLRVEVEWLLHLARCPHIAELPPPSRADARAAHALWRDFTLADAAEIRAIERHTNHDVKAVEYFVKRRLAATPSFERHIEFVHFGCTSEDINNLAYALMVQDARNLVLAPALTRLIDALRALARPLADQPMLARTHGQAASPTTVGKELANTVVRLERQRRTFLSVELLGKMNGAVGNFNAHAVAYGDVDWPAESRAFVASLGLASNAYTTQIEPHDYLAELFHALARFNQVLLDFDQDVWGYIALGYFRQRPLAGETGSSTMPHKVNPIDFENSEGNLGIAATLLSHLAAKLAVSRWQRDLSDSTALRNVGTAFGHCLVAYDSACRGIGKLEVDKERVNADVDAAWEVLAEAVQTVMRAAGSPEPYEQLKNLTRGRRMDRSGFRALLGELDLPAAARERLATLTPPAYTGLAETLARSALDEPAEGQEILPVRVFEAPFNGFRTALTDVRRTVFIEEQGVSEDEEWDGEDGTAQHFLAEDADGRAIGVARLLPTGQIGRMAVLPGWRGRGIGARLLRLAVRSAEAAGHERVFLHAQVQAVGFYEREGFVVSGEPFDEAGIEHRLMTPG